MGGIVLIPGIPRTAARNCGIKDKDFSPMSAAAKFPPVVNGHGLLMREYVGNKDQK